MTTRNEGGALTFSGCEVILSTGKSLKFDHPVAEILPFERAAVVRLNSPVGSAENENVYGIDYEGEVLWRVPRRRTVYQDSPYTGMRAEADRVRLFNWDGLELLIDPTTGGVLEERSGK